MLRTLARTALALFLAVGVSLAMPAPAAAEWDVNVFVKLRDEAQSLYDKGQYNDALSRYRVLRNMIEDAVENDEIPENQRPAALEALEVVRYQIGRCLQFTEACGEAVDEYIALAEDAESNEIKAKTAVRKAEARLCHAQMLAKDGDVEEASSAVSKVLDDLSAIPSTEGLSDETSTTVVSTRSVVETNLDEVEDAVFNAAIENVEDAIAAESCETARAGVAAIDPKLAPSADDGKAKKQALYDDVEAMCTRLASADAAPDPTPADEGVDIPIGPVITLSVGAAILAGWGVFEGVVGQGQVDDFEAARSDCRDTGQRCDEALTLKDDVETSQIISISLLAGGGAVLLGGATWWIIDAAMGDESAPEEAGETSAFLAPSADGGVIGVRVRLR